MSVSPSMSAGSTESSQFPVPKEIAVVRQPCWCGATAERLLCSEDRWGQALQTVVCKMCGTIRLNPRMTQEQATYYYGSIYPEQHLAPAQFFENQVMQGASHYIRPFVDKDMLILDYGCGPGGKLAKLAEDGYQIYGHDLNDQYVQYAQDHGIRPFRDDLTYGCIYLAHTLEHWIDPVCDLQTIIRRYLKDKGLIIIEVPLIDRLLLGDRRNGIQGDTYFPHAWYFSVTSLDKLMARLGCKRIYTDRVTLCVYIYDALHVAAAVRSTSIKDRCLHTMIALCSNPAASRVVKLLNRFIRYIDVRHYQAVERETH